MKVTTKFGSEVRLISIVDDNSVRVQSVALGDFSIKKISDLRGDVQAAIDHLKDNNKIEQCTCPRNGRSMWQDVPALAELGMSLVRACPIHGSVTC